MGRGPGDLFQKTLKFKKGAALQILSLSNVIKQHFESLSCHVIKKTWVGCMRLLQAIVAPFNSLFMKFIYYSPIKNLYLILFWNRHKNYTRIYSLLNLELQILKIPNNHKRDAKCSIVHQRSFLPPLQPPHPLPPPGLFLVQIATSNMVECCSTQSLI